MSLSLGRDVFGNQPKVRAWRVWLLSCWWGSFTGDIQLVPGLNAACLTVPEVQKFQFKFKGTGIQTLILTQHVVILSGKAFHVIPKPSFMALTATSLVQHTQRRPAHDKQARKPKQTEEHRPNRVHTSGRPKCSSRSGLRLLDSFTVWRL